MCAVHDGYVLQKSISRTPVAGKVLSQCLLGAVAAKGGALRPRYALEKVEHKPGEFHVSGGGGGGACACVWWWDGRLVPGAA